MLAVVCGPHEKVEVSIRASSLGERGLYGRVLCPAKVHSLAQAKHGPAGLRTAEGHADARPPVVAEAGHFSR